MLTLTLTLTLPRPLTLTLTRAAQDVGIGPVRDGLAHQARRAP